MSDHQDVKLGSPSSEVFDAYTLVQIAPRIKAMGASKASISAVPLMTISVLAGAFIAFGAMFNTVAVTNTELGFGPIRLLDELAFSLGLVLVIVGGVELLTGNSLIVMGWAHGKVRLSGMAWNWAFAYVGNQIGVVSMAILAFWSGYLSMDGNGVGATALKVAAAKPQLPFDVALIRGVLRNTLVCLAVWLCFVAHTITSKILTILSPISAFVALGFEHSIANVFLSRWVFWRRVIRCFPRR